MKKKNYFYHLGRIDKRFVGDENSTPQRHQPAII
jgi:hypothetical protein